MFALYCVFIEAHVERKFQLILLVIVFITSVQPWRIAGNDLIYNRSIGLPFPSPSSRVFSQCIRFIQARFQSVLSNSYTFPNLLPVPRHLSPFHFLLTWPLLGVSWSTMDGWHFIVSDQQSLFYLFRMIYALCYWWLSNSQVIVTIEWGC